MLGNCYFANTAWEFYGRTDGKREESLQRRLAQRSRDYPMIRNRVWRLCDRRELEALRLIFWPCVLRHVRARYPNMSSSPAMNMVGIIALTQVREAVRLITIVIALR